MLESPASNNSGTWLNVQLLGPPANTHTMSNRSSGQLLGGVGDTEPSAATIAGMFSCSQLTSVVPDSAHDLPGQLALVTLAVAGVEVVAQFRGQRGHRLDRPLPVPPAPDA